MAHHSKFARERHRFAMSTSILRASRSWPIVFRLQPVDAIPASMSGALKDDPPPFEIAGRIASEKDVLDGGLACRADAFSLPFADGSFETVVTDPPWKQLTRADRQELFAEAVRVAAPTGTIVCNTPWITDAETARRYETRLRQEEDFCGNPSFICLSRRLARDLDELFDAHDYDSVERYPESSPFWSECFHPNAVSAEHNTDPKKVSTAPQHSEWCCPKCGCSRLHHVRSSGFERNGRYPLYECFDCGFRATREEIDELVSQNGADVEIARTLAAWCSEHSYSNAKALA